MSRPTTKVGALQMGIAKIIGQCARTTDGACSEKMAWLFSQWNVCVYVTTFSMFVVCD